MKTNVLLLSVFILIVGFADQVVAQNENRQMNRRDCFYNDLTEDQQNSIETTRIQSNKRIVAYKADLEIKKAELRKMKIAENPSVEEMNRKVDEIAVIKSNMEKEKIAKDVAIREVLTPEQKAKYDMHRAYRKHDNRMHSGMKGYSQNMRTDRKHLNPDCRLK